MFTVLIFSFLNCNDLRSTKECKKKILWDARGIFNQEFMVDETFLCSFNTIKKNYHELSGNFYKFHMDMIEKFLIFNLRCVLF